MNDAGFEFTARSIGRIQFQQVGQGIAAVTQFAIRIILDKRQVVFHQNLRQFGAAFFNRQVIKSGDA